MMSSMLVTNNTRIAKQRHQTVEAEADRKLSRSISKDPNVLVSKCFDALKDMVREEQQIPAGRRIRREREGLIASLEQERIPWALVTAAVETRLGVPRQLPEVTSGARPAHGPNMISQFRIGVATASRP